MSGNDLIEEFCRTRGELAFAALVRAYTPFVYSVAQRRLSNGSLAEEVCQIVFIRLAKAFPPIAAESELLGWLHRTSLTVSIDLWRSESRRHARETRVADMQTNAPDPVWEEVTRAHDKKLRNA